MWIELRLTLTFEALYPGKKTILVLDNAPYHEVKDENYVFPGDMNRQPLIDELLLTADMEFIEVDREGQVKRFDLKAARNAKKGSVNSPTVKELRAALSEYLKGRPDLQRSKLRAYFEEKDWILVFTPPYTPVVQPSEFCGRSRKIKWLVGTRTPAHSAKPETN